MKWTPVALHSSAFVQRALICHDTADLRTCTCPSTHQKVQQGVSESRTGSRMYRMERCHAGTGYTM
jgi:hypothetical protein